MKIKRISLINMLISLLSLLAFFVLELNIAHAADMDMKSLKSASGFDLKYGTPYVIFNKNDETKRGGLTYEPYLNFDTLLYSNSPFSMGTPMIIEGKVSGSTVYSKDSVNIRSSSSNWSGHNYWTIRQNFVSAFKKDMVLYNKADTQDIVGSKDNTIGFSSIDADYALGNFHFKLRSVDSEYGSSEKLWLYSYNGFTIGGSIPQNIDHVYAKIPTTMKFYETDYRTSFRSLIPNTDTNKVTYTIRNDYHNASVRYILKVNGRYLSESYRGVSYYSSKKTNSEYTDITTDYILKNGDVLTLDVVTGTPGQSNYAKLQNLSTLFWPPNIEPH